MLVLVMLLTSLHFVDSYLEKRHRDFENFISELIRQPVSIGKIAVGNSGLEPVLEFSDVAIFNDTKTKVLLQAQGLQVGIDLINSLLKWRTQIGLLVVRGIDFFVYQDKDGGIRVSGVKERLNNVAAKSNFAIDEVLQWLLEQNRIDLSDVALTWRLADGEVLKFSALHLELCHGVLHYDLKINGRFVQKHYPPAKFSVNWKFRGDILKKEIASVHGDIVVEDWFYSLPQKFSSSNFFVPATGDINLSIKNSRVRSKVFRQPLAIDNLASRIIWQHLKDGFKVRVSKFKCNDAWLDLRGDMQFLLPTGKADAVVDMQLDFNLANLNKAKLYYPVTVLPPDATSWLDQAFVNSKAMRGTLILQGPIAKFPFDNNEGRFLVNANIRDVRLNYNVAWPPVENLNGKMIFANRSMMILTHGAKIMRVPVKSIKATISDLDMPVLSIDSSIHTDSSVGLRFIKSSPLRKTVAKKLRSLKLTGSMQLLLKMVIPLSSLVQQKNTQISGDITLHKNYLSTHAGNFRVENIQGKLHFTEDELLADKISGRLFDRPVFLTVNTLNSAADDSVVHVTMVGSATTKNIEKAFAVKLEPYLVGDFKYQVLLELHDLINKSVVRFDSDLQGVAINLPKPFAKNATRNNKINLAYYFGDNKLSRMIVNYNKQVYAVLTIKKGRGQLGQRLAGEIGIGVVPPKVPATSGLVVSGKIKNLDWSVWRDYFTKTKNNFTKISVAISQINLHVDDLRVLGQRLKKVMLQAKPQTGGWDIMLTTPTIQGKIFFPRNVESQIQGVFQRLDFVKEQHNISLLKPNALPPLHFIISDFSYENKIFSNVELITERQAKGLKINKISINDSQFSLVADGDWFVIDGKQQSVLRGKVSSNDIGGLLKQLKLTSNLVGGKGEANFMLKWPGAPYKPVLSEVAGSFVISAKKGHIVNLSEKTETKLGFGRVLNILSLRYLSLNFGDLTKKGFGFDKMQGDFKLTQGNVFASSIMLDGMIALIKVHGRIGLIAQDYDIVLSVTPHFTSSVPVAATVAGGPVVGLLSWVVADVIVAPVLKKAITYTYHITGLWNQPIINKK